MKAPILTILITFYLHIVGEVHFAYGKDTPNKEEETDEDTTVQTQFQPTDKYVHKWVKLPQINGLLIRNLKKYRYNLEYGTAVVVVFLASWCLPCQDLVQDIMKLEKKYQNMHTKFFYIFAYDRLNDSLGFINTYKMNGVNILASEKMWGDFHQPTLPSIYISDRHNWLVFRSLKTNRDDLEVIDDFLAVHTSY